MEVATSALNAGLADLTLAAAQASVRKYLDQEITFVSGDIVLLDGNGKPWLRLPERPVRAVTTVEEGDGTTADFEAVEAVDYVLRRSILYRVDGGYWTPGNVNIRVTYDHGWDVGEVDSDSDSDFDSPNVPGDIVLATLSAARRLYENTGTGGSSGDIVQETIGSYSYTLSSEARRAGGVGLIDAEKLIIERYRFGGAG